MRAFVAAGVVLVILGVLRMAAFVWAEPLAGYANNYDFIRLEACIGLYPDLPPDRQLAAHPSAPLPRYVLGDPVPRACQQNPAMLFAAIAIGAHRLVHPDETRVPLRWIGYATLGIAACMALVLCGLLRAHPRASLVHGLTFLLVLADPLLTLYFNALYAEPATFLGAYFLVGLLMAAALRGALTWALAVGIAAATLMVGLSKEQFFLLPAAILLGFAVMAGRPVVRSGAFAACLMAALVPVILFIAPISATPRPYPAHRVDTYLGALPASSSNPLRTLERLGLPPRCEALVGATWLRLRGEDVASTCPEVLGLPHHAFVGLALQEPMTLVRAFAGLGIQSQNAFGGLLGVVEGMDYGALGALPAWRRSLWEPLFQWLPVTLFVGLVSGVLAASLVWALFAALRRAPALAAAGTYPALLALVIAYTTATALLGDGFGDASKHVNGGALALAAWLVAMLACALPRMRDFAVDPWARAGAAIAALAMIGSGAATTLALRDVPLGFGVMDVPEGNRFDPAAPQVRGWALDPQGIERVDVFVGEAATAATYGVDKPGLDRVYPSLPQSARGGFEARLDPALLKPGVTVKVVATNRRGIRSEIDRRRVAAPPPGG